eukprot:5808023-Amphidinium_carterae.1
MCACPSTGAKGRSGDGGQLGPLACDGRLSKGAFATQRNDFIGNLRRGGAAGRKVVTAPRGAVAVLTCC